EGRGVAREAARFRERPGARGRDRGSWVSRGGEHEPRRRTDGVPFAPPPAGRPADDVAAGVASTPVDREGLPPALGGAKFLCPSQLPRGWEGGDPGRLAHAPSFRTAERATQAKDGRGAP